jgi:hypothetical protein
MLFIPKGYSSLFAAVGAQGRKENFLFNQKRPNIFGNFKTLPTFSTNTHIKRQKQK